VTRWLGSSLVVLALATSVLLAGVLGGDPAGPADRDEALKAYAACVGKAGDPACRALRSRVVAMLVEDLRDLATAPDRRYMSLLVAELKVREPELRAAAADAIGIAGATAAEAPALLAALNDPVPAVREGAAASLALASDPIGEAAVERYVRIGNSKSMVPQTAPVAQGLEVPLYPNAKYHFGTSGPSDQRFEFSTSDSSAKVVAFYKAKAKKGPLTAAELQEAYSSKSMMDAMKDKELTADDAIEMAMKMSEQMMKDMEGKSPEEMGKAVTAGAAAQGTPLPIERFERIASYGAPQFLVLEEATYLGTVRPLRYVVVYEDKVFGKTGFAVLRVSQ
jgi:hypothetical protein